MNRWYGWVRSIVLLHKIFLFQIVSYSAAVFSNLSRIQFQKINFLLKCVMLWVHYYQWYFSWIMLHYWLFHYFIIHLHLTSYLVVRIFNEFTNSWEWKCEHICLKIELYSIHYWIFICSRAWYFRNKIASTTEICVISSYPIWN